MYGYDIDCVPSPVTVPSLLAIDCESKSENCKGDVQRCIDGTNLEDHGHDTGQKHNKEEFVAILRATL